jgi:hypothetical protein
MRYLNSSALLSSMSHKAADDTGTDKADDKQIDKAVYLKPAATLENVTTYIENAAHATLQMVGAMVTHLLVAVYNPVIADRVKLDEAKGQIEQAFKAFGKKQRGGKEFGRAWVYRFLSLSVNTARDMVKDGVGKSVEMPFHQILRSKTADKAMTVAMEYITTKTKGENSFAALERYVEGKVSIAAPAQANQKGGRKGGNNVTASKDAPNKIAAALTGKDSSTSDILKAIPGNAKAKAVKMADKVMTKETPIDREAFVMRAIEMMDDPKSLLRIAKAAEARAMELGKAQSARKGQHERTAARHAEMEAAKEAAG